MLLKSNEDNMFNEKLDNKAVFTYHKNTDDDCYDIKKSS